MGATGATSAIDEAKRIIGSLLAKGLLTEEEVGADADLTSIKVLFHT